MIFQLAAVPGLGDNPYQFRTGTESRNAMSTVPARASLISSPVFAASAAPRLSRLSLTTSEAFLLSLNVQIELALKIDAIEPAPADGLVHLDLMPLDMAQVEALARSNELDRHDSDVRSLFAKIRDAKAAKVVQTLPIITGELEPAYGSRPGAPAEWLTIENPDVAAVLAARAANKSTALVLPRLQSHEQDRRPGMALPLRVHTITTDTIPSLPIGTRVVVDREQRLAQVGDIVASQQARGDVYHGYSKPAFFYIDALRDLSDRDGLFPRRHRSQRHLIHGVVIAIYQVSLTQPAGQAAAPAKTSRPVFILDMGSAIEPYRA